MVGLYPVSDHDGRLFHAQTHLVETDNYLEVFPSLGEAYDLCTQLT